MSNTWTVYRNDDGRTLGFSRCAKHRVTRAFRGTTLLSETATDRACTGRCAPAADEEV